MIWEGVTISPGGAQASPGDSAWAWIHCRWICMDWFDSLVRVMLD